MDWVLHILVALFGTISVTLYLLLKAGSTKAELELAVIVQAQQIKTLNAQVESLTLHLQSSHQIFWTVTRTPEPEPRKFYIWMDESA